MNDYQKTTLWLGALRYYMGRMTYAVTDFCDLLIQEWPNLDDETKLLIQRDLTNEIMHDDKKRAADVDGTRHHKRLGHDCDRLEWDRVVKLWEAA